MPRLGGSWLMLALALAGLGCESREAKEARAEREIAQREARFHANEAARAQDVAARIQEDVDATKLRNSIASRERRRKLVAEDQAYLARLPRPPRAAAVRAVDEKALAEDTSHLAEAEDDLQTERISVTGERSALLQAKQATERLLADRTADAGLDRDVLEARLAGIVKSLAEIDEVLALDADAGA